MKTKRLPPTAEYDKGAPSRDGGDRFAEDAFLRRRGWSVVSRPADGEALWKCGPLVLTHTDALAFESGELANANYFETGGADA